MYNFNLLDSIEDIKKEFAFLVEDYNFNLIKESSTNKGVTYLYYKGEIRINLYYDYRENFFYFEIIKGKETQIPNDKDFKNIIPFYKFVQSYEPSFDINKLQPDDYQYIDALKINALAIRKYGDKMFR
jgi:hypothetical protein